MPITSIDSDPRALTLTAVGDYPVPVERLWAAWVDPRKLERFWGPPQWPATFTHHEVREGGRSSYFMTGPRGESSHGYWEFETVEPERRFVIKDGFAHPDGSPNTEFPEMRMEVTFEKTDQGSRFVARTTFPSVEAMEKVLAMGMVEGMTAAMGQLDHVLSDLRDLSANMKAALEVIDDTHVVIKRVVRGSIEQVWRAYNDAELLQKWLLGPDGWTMPVCEVATEVGATYRYEWENETDGKRFGSTGELVELEAPRRAVTTEQMIGVDDSPNKNELLLSPRPGRRTMIEVHIEYPSKEVRDIVLGTGMVEGMESSYARMERMTLAA